jgi:hypothetical protein
MCSMVTSVLALCGPTPARNRRSTEGLPYGDKSRRSVLRGSLPLRTSLMLGTVTKEVFDEDIAGEASRHAESSAAFISSSATYS